MVRFRNRVLIRLKPRSFSDYVSDVVENTSGCTLLSNHPWIDLSRITTWVRNLIWGRPVVKTLSSLIDPVVPMDKSSVDSFIRYKTVRGGDE